MKELLNCIIKTKDIFSEKLNGAIIMNKPIKIMCGDLPMFSPGYFLNSEISVDFQITYFVDRTARLVNRKGNIAIVDMYSWSLNDLDELHECKVIIASKPLKKFENSIPQYIVEDVSLFMIQLATYVRERYQNPVIGITGSAGKSTTAKMLWHLLRHNNASPMVNIGNHNDRESVPYYLSNVIDDRNPEQLILEVAADSLLKEKRFGNLALVAQPDIGLVTSIGGAHLSKYIDDGNVSEIKSGLVEGIKENGHLVINDDIAENEKLVFMEKARTRNLKVLTYSMENENADAYLLKSEFHGDYTEVQVSMNGCTYSYQLPGGDDGRIQNSLGVLLTLYLLKMDLTEELLARFHTTTTLPRVLTTKTLNFIQNKKVTLVDDTHNSSVPSMKNAIEYFSKLAKSNKFTGNKLLILSKVADLGPNSQKIHYQFIQSIADSNADYIFLYGDLMLPLMKELRKMKKLCYHYTDLDTMITEAVELLEDDSLVLMKGSRSESDFQLISQKLPEKIEKFGYEGII